MILDPRFARALRFAPAVASLLMFALALVALHRLAGEFHLSDVRAAFTAMSSARSPTARSH